MSAIQKAPKRPSSCSWSNPIWLLLLLLPSVGREIKNVRPVVIVLVHDVIAVVAYN
jgi:hypothetical protein